MKCLLKHPSSTDFVAIGTVQQLSDDRMIHNQYLPNHWRIVIDQSLFHDCPLPVPSDATTVQEAVGQYVAWPSIQVVLNFDVVLFFNLKDNTCLLLLFYYILYCY